MKNKKPFIIEIEGLDKAGKHTIASLLKNQLNTNYKMITEIISFPRYKTPIGKMIREWLTNDPNQKDTSHISFELMQNLDKQLFTDKLNKGYYNHCDVIILDRYIYSQLAYGQYQNDINWLENLATYIIKPDLVIYLDVTPENSMARKGEHGENDKYESNLDLLTKLKTFYSIALESQKDKIIINANNTLDNTKERLIEHLYTIHAFIEYHNNNQKKD